MSKEINMDIEVGDYVRSRNGSIGKVTKIEDDKYLYENKELITFIGNVVKHSKNIIDLIEVGDFVNGREVKHIAMFEGFPNYPKLIFVDEKRLIPDDTCENDEIKTILTKEQYSQNCYAVERS